MQAMITMLQNWKGEVDINDKHYADMQTATSDFKGDYEEIHIILHSNAKKPAMSVPDAFSETYKITVKPYMTKKASPDFDFMAKWNNDNPMPLRTMTGTIEKETRGMVYMHLHGVGEPTVNCMRCGRELTHPVSRLYGIGPECIKHIPIIAEIDMDDVDNIKNKMQEVEWSGWVIKSAITSKELIDE